MSRITKREAIKIVSQCSKDYHDYLLPYKYLIIGRNLSSKQISCFEIRFPKKAFRHLTGIKMSDITSINSALEFFDACIGNKLSEDDILDPRKSDADRKLNVLPQMIKFMHYSKMTVLYDGGRPKLVCDKVIGTTNFSMALDQMKKYYVPASCLEEDVRNFGKDISQVIAIFQAQIDEEIYKDIRNVAKGINLKNVTFPNEYRSIIDLSNYRR